MNWQLAKLHLVATSGILEFRTPLDSARREQSIDVRFMRGTEIESVQKPFASFTKFGDFDCNAIYKTHYSTKATPPIGHAPF
jgi:hypothetical protein